MAVRGGKRSKKTRGRQPCGGRRKKATKRRAAAPRRTMKGRQRGFSDKLNKTLADLRKWFQEKRQKLR